MFRDICYIIYLWAILGLSILLYLGGAIGIMWLIISL